MGISFGFSIQFVVWVMAPMRMDLFEPLDFVFDFVGFFLHFVIIYFSKVRDRTVLVVRFRLLF